MVKTQFSGYLFDIEALEIIKYYKSNLAETLLYYSHVYKFLTRVKKGKIVHTIWI